MIETKEVVEISFCPDRDETLISEFSEMLQKLRTLKKGGYRFESVKIVRDALEYRMVLIKKEEPVPEENAVTSPSEFYGILTCPIKDMLSARTYKILHKAGIETVADLVNKAEDQVKIIKNFGAKSLEEVKTILTKANLHFGMKSLPEK